MDSFCYFSAQGVTNTAGQPDLECVDFNDNAGTGLNYQTDATKSAVLECDASGALTLYVPVVALGRSSTATPPEGAIPGLVTFSMITGLACGMCPTSGYG